MKWYTCIISNPNHVTPVQYFFTRAESPNEAESNAFKWIFGGDADYEDPEVRDQVGVPLIFEGRIEPCEVRQ